MRIENEPFHPEGLFYFAEIAAFGWQLYCPNFVIIT